MCVLCWLRRLVCLVRQEGIPKDGNHVNDEELVLQVKGPCHTYFYGNEKEVEELNDDPNGPTHLHCRKDLRDGLVPRPLRLALAVLGIMNNHLVHLQKGTEHEHSEGDNDGAGELGE